MSERNTAVIATSLGPMTAEQIVDHLTYVSYRVNRDAAPHITPEAWAKAGFPNVPEMEARYQADLALRKAAS